MCRLTIEQQQQQTWRKGVRRDSWSVLVEEAIAFFNVTERIRKNARKSRPDRICVYVQFLII